MDKLNYFIGTPLNYQFLKKENGFWYVHLTFEVEPTELVSHSKFGALGIDLNPSLAITQIDPCGNLQCSWQIPAQLRGKTSEQIEAVLEDEIAKGVSTAKKKQLPIVIEELDFEAKNLQLRSTSMNQMLSQFSYAKFNSMITARCLVV